MNENDLLDWYKPSADEIAAFGENWIGAESYDHGEWTLVAKYQSPPDDDGQSVVVYRDQLPAAFYKIKAVGGKNSVGEYRPGYEITTGSGMHKLAADIAKAISQGMVGLHH